MLQTVQEQKNLISQLETDLLRAQPYMPVRTEGEVRIIIQNSSAAAKSFSFDHGTYMYELYAVIQHWLLASTV